MCEVGGYQLHSGWQDLPRARGFLWCERIMIDQLIATTNDGEKIIWGKRVQPVSEGELRILSTNNNFKTTTWSQCGREPSLLRFWSNVANIHTDIGRLLHTRICWANYISIPNRQFRLALQLCKTSGSNVKNQGWSLIIAERFWHLYFRHPIHFSKSTSAQNVLRSSDKPTVLQTGLSTASIGTWASKRATFAASEDDFKETHTRSGRVPIAGTRQMHLPNIKSHTHRFEAR